MTHVKTEIFEGPLEMLLTLIEKRKLFINDISLAKVADDYIETVRSLPEIPLKDVANFVFVASTLVLIKSKSLLPALDLSGEEQGDIENLKDRLAAYQRIKELSVQVQERFGKNILYEREMPKNPLVFSAPGADLTLENIFESVENILSHLPKMEMAPTAVIKKMVTLEEAMGKLVKRIELHLRISFKSYVGLGSAERQSVIVSFLAVLELIKRGAIDATQKDNFSDFQIETRKLSVPKYGE